MAPHVVVSHYPEGAGHATRMMAVARGLQDCGASVSLAGGGPGQEFYESNGFDPRILPEVDYVRNFQRPGGTARGLAHVLRDSLLDSVRRVRAVVGWIRRESPDAVVTDDMFTAAAAVRTGTPLYVLTHNAAGLYRNAVVGSTTRGLTLGQRLAARRFFYPTAWPPHRGDPPQVSRVPPVALDPPPGATDAGPSGPGVVVVPSTYSTGFDGLAASLREAGHEVTHVGDPDWDPVPALLPVLRRAEAVVCAGYSTIMEAGVAGTPCVVLPRTNEQRGVARRLDDVTGFAVVDGPEEVRSALADPPDPPEFDNGVATISERILDDLDGSPRPVSDDVKTGTGRGNGQPQTQSTEPSAPGSELG